MTHPFVKGQVLRCIDASGGAPLQEGHLYTTSRTFRGPPPWGAGDGPLPGMSKVYGVEVEEMLGDAFRADRFEAYTQ